MLDFYHERARPRTMIDREILQRLKICLGIKKVAYRKLKNRGVMSVN